MPGPTGPRYDPSQFDTPPSYSGVGGGPNYGAKIDRWQDKLKAGKGNANKLRNKIQDAKVARWSDRVNDRPLPGHDAQYLSDVAAAERSKTGAYIGAAMGIDQTERSYGFNPAYASPTSRASLLEASYRSSQRDDLNSYASSGQLYSGALRNAQASNQADYADSITAAQQQYTADLAGYAADKTSAETAYADAVQKAGLEELDRIPEVTDAPPPPKFVRKEKKQLKSKIGKLQKGKEGKKQRKQIKRLKGKLKSIPDQYSEE